MVKHIYSAEAALTGTDRVELIVRIIRENNKSQQMSRPPLGLLMSQTRQEREEDYSLSMTVAKSCLLVKVKCWTKETTED